MKHLMWNDLKRSISIKRILYFGIAAFLSLFFFVQFFAGDMQEERLIQKLHIGIIDKEQSEMSGLLISSFKNNTQFTSLVNIVEGSEDSVRDVYGSGQLTAMLIIPETFTESLLHYENEALQIVLNPQYPLSTAILSEMLDSYSDYIRSVDSATYGLFTTLQAYDYPAEELNRVNELYSIEMIGTALGRNKLFEYNIIDTFPSTTSLTYFTASILVIVISYASTGIVPLYFEDIRTHCLMRYAVSTRGLFTWLLSKALAASLNATLLGLIISIPLFFILKLGFVSSALFIVQIFMLSMFFSTLSLWIAMVTGSENTAAVTASLTLFVLGLAGGNFIPLPLMPKALQDVCAYTPNFWAIKALLHTLSHIEPPLYTVMVLGTLFALMTLLAGSIKLRHTIRLGGIRYD